MNYSVLRHRIEAVISPDDKRAFKILPMFYSVGFPVKTCVLRFQMASDQVSEHILQQVVLRFCYYPMLPGFHKPFATDLRFEK